MEQEISQTDLQMDDKDLYKEEVFVDRKGATIRQLTPVKSDGSNDESRQSIFMGQAQLLTPVGALPLSFEIEASSLTEAIEKFPGAVKEAVDGAVEEMKELRRKAASSIVVPDVGSGNMGGPGGISGGGKIQMP